MAPQRVADAAHISPYPFVVRQDRSAIPPPESAPERGRHAKGKKAKARTRAERNQRQEEEMRFNTGPRNIRSPPANSGGRRGFRMPGRAYPDDRNGVPDYPPPSFQEAMTSPPLSVCSSTTSLAPAPSVPVRIPESIPERILEEIPEQPMTSTERLVVDPLNETTASDNGSDSDESMFIIDKNSIPICSSDLPKGAALEERIKRDWRRRRGVEFPASSEPAHKPSDNNETQTASRGRSAKRLPILNIDPEAVTDDDRASPSPVSSPKRRFLSLSPLRTIFPSRSSVHQDRTMSAHPSPSVSSPYSGSRIFFRSSTSLATASFLKLPLSSATCNGKSESFISRITHKGKERAKGSGDYNNDAWDVVEESDYADVDKEGDVVHRPSLLSAIESMTLHNSATANMGTSPTRSQSFTFGSQNMVSGSMRSESKQNHASPRAAQSSDSAVSFVDNAQVALLRDWKGPSTAFVDRPINRRSVILATSIPDTPDAVTGAAMAVPIMLDMETISMSSGPPLTSIRIRPTAPSPPPSLAKHTAHVPSPLRVDAKPNITIDHQSAAAAAMHQRALETPLPMTPDYHTHFDYGAPSASINRKEEETPPLGIALPARSVPDLLTDTVLNPAPEVPPSCSCRTAAVASPSNPPLSISVLGTTINSSMKKSSSSVEEQPPLTPTRHHYAGRPLPRPPPTSNRVGAIDSTYASTEGGAHDADKSANDGRTYNACPEGLLIDLDDTTLDNFSGSGPSTPRSDEGRFWSQSHLPLGTPASSSVDFAAAEPAAADVSSLSFTSMQATSTPLNVIAPGPTRAPYGAQGGAGGSTGFSELTDLDLLVSRLEENIQNGSDYETLLLVSELIGPASPITLSQAHTLSPPTALASSPPTTATNSTTSPRTSDSASSNTSLVGRIEETRRRRTPDGLVKLKLTLLDVAVDRCGICLSQFKHGDMAALTSVCQHSFHETCLGRWLARSKTCPLCRVPLDTDVR